MTGSCLSSPHGFAPSPELTLALVVGMTGPALRPHFDRQVFVHTGHIGHGLWRQQDHLVVAFAPGHCAVVQGPGLIHLGRER